MDKNEIARTLATAKVPEYKDADLPSIEERIDFIDTQIAEIKKVIFRFVFELEVYKFYMENKDENVQETGQSKYKENAVQLKSYLITLKGLRRVKAGLMEQLAKKEPTTAPELPEELKNEEIA